MKTNPLRNHTIGASGCDGTIKGFISSRATMAKYNALKGMKFPFEIIAEIALETKGDTAKELLKWMKDVRRNVERSQELFDEVTLTFETLEKALEKVDRGIEELIQPEPVKTTA